MKKDLFERSGKVEELNQKISDLLDRNQKSVKGCISLISIRRLFCRLIEQGHQTAEQRNVVVNNVSEQTAQKILDLEKQKVELTNSLSLSTSRIADLQLQNNQYTQDINEHQSRLSSLLHKCEQFKVDLQRSENQRTEAQMKLESMQEELKNDKMTKKQLQINFNALEEELTELKITLSTAEKVRRQTSRRSFSVKFSHSKERTCVIRRSLCLSRRTTNARLSMKRNDSGGTMNSMNRSKAMRKISMNCELNYANNVPTIV